MIQYYFLVASQDFLLSQEPIEEILRERIKHYKELKKNIDFGVTTNLSFLNDPDLKYIKKQLLKPSAAIISLNPQFINWLKLRICYAIKGSFSSTSMQIQNSIASFDNVNVP
uniref:hypothetical protein n=1 Tax=Lithothamnion corallioides TaxID=1277934 RepID=UPI0023EFCCF7|nr:hypothetical protein P6G75_pgp104 [Lithothamnion corallioides]WEA77131.1 hypothetical protein [Lithothamnion corallioides]